MWRTSERGESGRKIAFPMKSNVFFLFGVAAGVGSAFVASLSGAGVIGRESFSIQLNATSSGQA